MIKVYESLKNGNYNFYVFRNKKWEKLNYDEITDFNKIDKDSIDGKEFINKCFNSKDWDLLGSFCKFLKSTIV